MDWLRLIPLIIATALIVAGTAITWHVVRTTNLYNGDSSGRSAASYDSICFVYALLAAWVYWFAGSKDDKGKSVYGFLFYGLFFYAAVESTNDSVQFLDDVRYAARNAPTEDNKRYFAGLILNYLGIFFALSVVHGKWELRCNLATFLYLAAIGLQVVGSIILWNYDGTKHSSNDGTSRTIVFDITISQWWNLLILAGAIFHDRPDSANLSAAIVGIWGLWYLQGGFLLKGQAATEGYIADQVQKAWAGSLFCWFSAWLTLIVARFAAVHHSLGTAA